MLLWTLFAIPMGWLLCRLNAFFHIYPISMPLFFFFSHNLCFADNSVRDEHFNTPSPASQPWGPIQNWIHQKHSTSLWLWLLTGKTFRYLCVCACFGFYCKKKFWLVIMSHCVCVMMICDLPFHESHGYQKKMYHNNPNVSFYFFNFYLLNLWWTLLNKPNRGQFSFLLSGLEKWMVVLVRWYVTNRNLF